ncbi:GSCOCG00006110001-RA-CDS [Cotesia congregata]|nr:GSCOCG00006110001-RA-CDS [Cotesia congregata]
MLNVGKTSHHSESSESSTHLKQGLWNSDFGFDKKVEKQSKVEISHHQKSSSLANHSQSSVQHDSHSSDSSSSHISSSHLKSSHSSSKFHQSMSSSHIGNLENSVIDIRVKP